MEIVLIVAGVMAIALAFALENPTIRERFVNPEAVKRWQIEEARIKHLKLEVVQAKDEVAQLLVELERTSEKVVNDVAETIVDIQGQLRQSSQVPPAHRSPDVVYIPTPATQTPTPAKGSNQSRKAYSTSATATNQAEKTAAGKKSPKAAKKNQEAGQGVQGLDNAKHAKVYQLADQGFSIDEIAQKAKIGKGEVQLMLGLRGRGE